jgi:MFS family permease
MSDATAVSSRPDGRRWLILGVIGLAQLMVILDLTVMNVALPSAQRSLDFSTADRQWVVTAYTLSFGSLLLLGGRLADLLGRKVTFLAGLAGFASGVVVSGVLLRPGPLAPKDAPSQASGAVPTAQARTGTAHPA